MKIRIAAALLVVAFALAACASRTTDAAEAKGGEAEHFALEATPSTAKPGETGAWTIVVTPAEGYKWNLEYPTKLVVKQPETTVVRVKKPELKKGEPEVAASEAKATLALPFEAKAAGQETVQAELSFSVCTKTTCHVYRNRVVPLPITVH